MRYTARPLSQICSGAFLPGRHFTENAWAMNLAKHFPPMSNGEFESFFLPISANREGCAFLFTGRRSPTDRITFVYCPVRTCFCRAANTQHTCSIARITINDPPTPRLGGDLGQLFVKLIAKSSRCLLSFSFTPALHVAIKFGVGFSIFVPPHKPSMSRTRIYTAYSLVFWIFSFSFCHNLTVVIVSLLILIYL